MFAFPKNNASSTSTQSSADSFVTLPSNSTSVSDFGALQDSDASSYRDLPSEQLVGSFLGKFTLRSRSNTATSITPSFTSPSPPRMTGPDTSSSRLLFKSKKSKRQSGSFSPQLHSNDHDESQIGPRRASMLRKNRKQGDQHENPAQNSKPRISSPFDFQHLTHTNRHHFASLQEVSENELVAGFRAVRASQAPRRDLNGIKAEDLHPSNYSTEELPSPERRSISAMELRPPPDFVDHVVDGQGFEPAQDESIGSPLRQVRSVESFSRPGLNTHMHRHTQSTNSRPLPPRGSSRLATTGTQDANTMQMNRQSGIWDNFMPLSPPLMGGALASMAEEPDNVGHALTTPDNSAIHTLTPPFTPNLEDVVEEPERFASPRPAPPPPTTSPKSPRSPSRSFSLNQRSPTSRSHNRRDSSVLPKALNLTQSALHPMSPMSETLASPGFNRSHSVRKPHCDQTEPNTWRVIEEPWEDDIDYIYDNALEAECELDWERHSSQETFDGFGHSTVFGTNSGPLSSPMTDGESALSPGMFSSSIRSTLLVPNANYVPELEQPRSAISSSTVDTRLHTPSDYFVPHGFPQDPFGQSGRFSFTPSLLSPQEYKEQLREDMYDSFLADCEGLDKHFPLLEPTRSIASSTRSSHVRTSKRSSYDSSFVSNGTGSWLAGVRRSASSAGSLPDLVHSSRAPPKDYSVRIDELAEGIASLPIQDTNADGADATPPGNSSPAKTFFAADDERTSPAKKMRTNHKYASSESAAKHPRRASSLRSIATHVRAGSAPQKSGGQYLDLFPAPPTPSATPVPTFPLGSPTAN